MVGYHNGQHDVRKREEKDDKEQCICAPHTHQLVQDAVKKEERVDGTDREYAGHDEYGAVDACNTHQPFV